MTAAPEDRLNGFDAFCQNQQISGTFPTKPKGTDKVARAVL